MTPQVRVLAIGSSPADEACVQVGTPGYSELARAECERFIVTIRAALGAEPAGCGLFVKSNAHDFGEYLEVAVKFDATTTAAETYALRCVNEAPANWPRD